MLGPEWETIDSDMSYWRRTPVLDEQQLREWEALRSFYEGFHEGDAVKREPGIGQKPGFWSEKDIFPLTSSMVESVLAKLMKGLMVMDNKGVASLHGLLDASSLMEYAAQNASTVTLLVAEAIWFMLDYHRWRLNQLHPDELDEDPGPIPSILLDMTGLDFHLESFQRAIYPPKRDALRTKLQHKLNEGMRFGDETDDSDESPPPVRLGAVRRRNRDGAAVGGCGRSDSDAESEQSDLDDTRFLPPGDPVRAKQVPVPSSSRTSSKSERPLPKQKGPTQASASGPSVAPEKRGTKVVVTSRRIRKDPPRKDGDTSRRKGQNTALRNAATALVARGTKARGNLDELLGTVKRIQNTQDEDGDAARARLAAEADRLKQQLDGLRSDMSALQEQSDAVHQALAGDVNRVRGKRPRDGVTEGESGRAASKRPRLPDASSSGSQPPPCTDANTTKVSDPDAPWYNQQQERLAQELREQLDTLRVTNKTLRAQLASESAGRADVQARLEDSLQRFGMSKRRHDEELTDLNTSHEEDITNIYEKHERDRAELSSRHEDELATLEAEHEDALAGLRAEHEADRVRSTALATEVAKLQADSAAFSERCTSAEAAADELRAETHGLRLRVSRVAIERDELQGMLAKGELLRARMEEEAKAAEAEHLDEALALRDANAALEDERDDARRTRDGARAEHEVAQRAWAARLAELRAEAKRVQESHDGVLAACKALCDRLAGVTSSATREFDALSVRSVAASVVRRGASVGGPSGASVSQARG
ncbi:hypothetical protein PsYK624_154470 [Phanerochaete sordida]|uniref:Uncharacterized protein n=1 Tax=Phanerochaete sordida TaxID=48140 RepID=A0A9P3GNV4_9APHY|nr:hypothetical protein PsYK624_154470 [Phanerochaete sordida]